MDLPIELIRQLIIRSDNLGIAVLYDQYHDTNLLTEIYRRDPSGTIDYLVRNDAVSGLRQLTLDGSINDCSPTDGLTGILLQTLRLDAPRVVSYLLTRLDELRMAPPTTAFYHFRIAGYQTEAGYLRTIRELQARGVPLSSTLYNLAIPEPPRSSTRRPKAVRPERTPAVTHQRYMAIIQYLWQQRVPIPPSAIRWAITREQYDVVDFYLTVQAPISPSTLEYAAGTGDLELVNRLLARQVPVSADALEKAIISGNLALVERLLAVGAPMPRNPVDTAAKHGHLALVERLLASGAPPVSSMGRFEAAAGGHLSVIKFLLERYPYPSTDYLDGAAGGQVELVQYLVARQAPASEAALPRAISSGQLTIVELLLAAKAPTSAHALEIAIKENQPEIARRLLAANVPIPRLALHQALKAREYEIARLLLATPIRWKALSTYNIIGVIIGSGQVDLLQRAIEVGFPIDDADVDCAVRKGMLEMIELLLQHGVRPTRQAGHEAVIFGQWNIVRYLLDHELITIDHQLLVRVVEWPSNQYPPVFSDQSELIMIQYLLDWVDHHRPGDELSVTTEDPLTPIEDLMVPAARRGHLELLQLLQRRLGLPTQNVLLAAAERGRLNVVKWLAGFPGLQLDQMVLSQAVASGALDLVEYLIRQRISAGERPVALPGNFVTAASNGNLELVELLLSVGVLTDDTHDDDDDDEPAGESALYWASVNGHLAVVQRLLSIGISIAEGTLDDVATRGEVDVVRELLAAGAAYTTEGITEAISARHRDTARLLVCHALKHHKDTKTINFDEVMTVAVSRLDVEIVRLVGDRSRSPIDPVNFVRTNPHCYIDSGYLEVLEYLVNRYDHADQVIRAAIQSRLSTEIIELISPRVSVEQRAALIAWVGNQNSDALEVLLARGYLVGDADQVRDAIRELIEQGSLRAVEQVLRYHPEHLEYTIVHAIDRDDSQVVERLLAHYPSLITVALDYARATGESGMVRLIEHTRDR